MSKASAVIPAQAGIQDNDLPEGWVTMPLENCAEILDSRRIPLNSKERSARIEGKSEDQLFPYYGATGQVGLIDDFIFEGEHLLIGEDGAPFFDKSKNVAYIAKGKFWVNNHAHILQALEGITSNKYLLHYLNKFNYKGFVGGTTRLKLNQANLKQIPVPLAPPEQQQLIVAKIEELFSHIDAGIEALKKAKQLLKQYRQSVLKAAVTGELTKEWREANKAKLEPASQLLDSILKKRRQKWEEQQLEQFEVKGKMPKDDKWKEKYKELAPISDAELDMLPKLPEGWVYTRMGNVIDEPKYGTSKKCTYDSKGTGVLRIPNVANGVIDSEDLKFAKFDNSEVVTYELREGDILTIRSNGSINLVGKCALIGEKDTGYLYAGYLIRLRPNSELVESLYLINVLNSILLRNQIESKAKSTSGVNNINSGELQSLIVPVCIKSEQAEISVLVDEKLEATDRLLSEIELQLTKSEKNKQSILASAFSGVLSHE